MDFYQDGIHYQVTKIERDDELMDVIIRERDTGLFVRMWEGIEEMPFDLRTTHFAPHRGPVRAKDRQAMQVLEAYEQYFGLYGQAPRLNDVQRITGLGRRLVLTALDTLVSYGFITRTPNTPRGVKLTLRRIDK